ncbi:hypothetical protein G9A89_000116 [Geosiphon pyriformis]|nr:hypothetical protein G9A89_000116 [Geosiphon pyriformis]
MPRATEQITSSILIGSASSAQIAQNPANFLSPTRGNQSTPLFPRVATTNLEDTLFYPQIFGDNDFGKFSSSGFLSHRDSEDSFLFDFHCCKMDYKNFPSFVTHRQITHGDYISEIGESLAGTYGETTELGWSPASSCADCSVTSPEPNPMPGFAFDLDWPDGPGVLPSISINIHNDSSISNQSTRQIQTMEIIASSLPDTSHPHGSPSTANQGVRQNKFQQSTPFALPSQSILTEKVSSALKSPAVSQSHDQRRGASLLLATPAISRRSSSIIHQEASLFQRAISATVFEADLEGMLALQEIRNCTQNENPLRSQGLHSNINLNHVQVSEMQNGQIRTNNIDLAAESQGRTMNISPVQLLSEPQGSQFQKDEIGVTELHYLSETQCVPFQQAIGNLSHVQDFSELACPHLSQDPISMKELRSLSKATCPHLQKNTVILEELEDPSKSYDPQFQQKTVNLAELEHFSGSSSPFQKNTITTLAMQNSVSTPPEWLQLDKIPAVDLQLEGPTLAEFSSNKPKKKRTASFSASFASQLSPPLQPDSKRKLSKSLGWTTLKDVGEISLTMKSSASKKKVSSKTRSITDSEQQPRRYYSAPTTPTTDIKILSTRSIPLELGSLPIGEENFGVALESLFCMDETLSLEAHVSEERPLSAPTLTTGYSHRDGNGHSNIASSVIHSVNSHEGNKRNRSYASDEDEMIAAQKRVTTNLFWESNRDLASMVSFGVPAVSAQVLNTSKKRAAELSMVEGAGRKILKTQECAMASTIIPDAMNGPLPMATTDEIGSPVIKPYKCSVSGCPKTYKNPNGLKYHNKYGHLSQETCSDERSTEKPYKCKHTTCIKSYKNQNGLKYHIQHHHGGIEGLDDFALVAVPNPFHSNH